MRRLGTVQQGVLDALHSLGAWRRGCGWEWVSHHRTRQVLDALVRRGLVVRDADGTYRPVRP